MDGLIKGIFLFNLCRESFHKTTFADVVDINQDRTVVTA